MAKNIKICEACGAESSISPCTECAKKKHDKLWARVDRACGVGVSQTKRKKTIGWKR